MWTKPLAAMATLGLVLAGTGMVIAGTRTGRTPVNCTDTTWQKSSVSTSSMDWANVPGLDANPTAIFPITVDVSATISGAPVRFRVVSTNVGEQTTVSQPGATRFDPGTGGPNAFSYQLIDRNQIGATHATRIRLQWRSPTGGAVTLLNGDMAVSYRTDGCDGEG